MALGSSDKIMLFVIGSPGAGKGTLCKMLCERLGWAHISVGDQVRQLVQTEETNDAVMKECVRKGELIPADSLAAILQSCKDFHEGLGHNKIIIDGFPRKKDQIDYVQAAIGTPDLVICLDCPEGSARDRVLNRQDAARAETDTDEIFDRRLKEFTANNEEIVAHYSEAGIVERIDTSGKSWESFELLLVALEKRGYVLTPDLA